jgi:excisionase family DNA binding protein
MGTKATKRRELLTIDDLIANLPPGRGARSTIHGWIAAGTLPSVKVGRARLIRRSDAARFLGIEPDKLIEAADLEASTDDGPQAA